jgi:hypothetical protein
MRERLHQFGELADRYGQSYNAPTWIGDEALSRQLWRAEPTIRKIFIALDPQLAEEFHLGSMAGDA